MKYSRIYVGEGLYGAFKNLALRVPFIAGALDDAYKKGGIDSFPLAQKDILETMRDDLDKKAEELAKEKLMQLLSIVDENKIVTFNEKVGAVFIGGERATEGQLLNLKQEAEALMKFDLWALIYETPKKLAHLAMFVSGESVDDMKKGRSMLYTLSTQKRIIETFKAYNPPKK